MQSSAHETKLFNPKLSAEKSRPLPTTFCVYDGCGFRSRLCPPWVDEVNKTKLQIYRSPAAGINTVLWPVGFRLQSSAVKLLFPCRLFYSPSVGYCCLVNNSCMALSMRVTLPALIPLLAKLYVPFLSIT